MWRSPAAVILGCLWACASERPPTASSGAEIEDCALLSDGVLCLGDVALQCTAGRSSARDDCSDHGEICGRTGCVACRPYSVRCDADVVMRCSADGSEFTEEARCVEGTQCSPEGCRDLCADARAQRSYLGCTYFPALPINSELAPDFFPAIVIGNPNLVPAEVTLSRAGELVARREVLAGAAESIALPRSVAFDVRGRSLLARGGAYQLTASVPVTVQQWNPLEFAQQCTKPDGGAGSCGSVTNDAALLVPAEALTRTDSVLEYIVATRPTFALRGPDGEVSGRSGFVMIVGASDAEAHVTIRSSSFTAASLGEGDDLPALSPGDTLQLTLQKGDVVQLLSAEDAPCATEPVAIQNGARACEPIDGYDLSGTEISSDAPISVVAGHDCTNVPFDRPACDHLEESLVPVDTWGRSVVVPRPRPSVEAAFLVQVVSADDDNALTFAPLAREEVRLARGESYVFSATRALEVSGSGRLLVLQYLQGQGEGSVAGDPSMTLAVAADQWRNEYAFLTPATYRRSYVTFVGRPGSVLELDGRRLPAFGTVDGLDIGASTQVLETPGTHRVSSVDGSSFGVQLYGVADYTSYMCPGGLDLRVLPEPG